MSNSFNKNKNNDNKNKIIIEDCGIITNGTPDQLKSINQNVIGNVVSEDGSHISEITALIMVLNQNAKTCQNKVNALIEAGANSDQKVSYYGKELSARDIASKYRTNIVI